MNDFTTRGNDLLARGNDSRSGTRRNDFTTPEKDLMPKIYPYVSTYHSKGKKCVWTSAEEWPSKAKHKNILMKCLPKIKISS